MNLFQIITHELGHSLGMAHSSDSNALMYAYYRGYEPHFQLGQDDIAGIQKLYGQCTQDANTAVTCKQAAGFRSRTPIPVINLANTE